ncbi:MAG: pyridoxal-phosphate dependent enzyme [Candidatus Erginobacter occultus]|nr:pyridoxal-phosphate dependent enzyme [Candidatus Erginobacter occultus]
MRDPQQVLENTIKRCRERDIFIPTYEQMANPEMIPVGVKQELKEIGLWDLHPRNLFRITWKNEPVESGGGYGGVNYVEIPRELTGVRARIFMLIGKYFPTGAHKVGATFGPLVEKLVRGEFDPTCQKALWPSTGNYCRGGAYDAYLLACPSIAVLPAGMSRERFDWLKQVGCEIYATPGSESNVKEVYDKTKELQMKRPDEVVVLNQFDQIGNAIWHYVCTGRAMEEVFLTQKEGKEKLRGVCLTQGSAGTLGCAEYLKEKYPGIKVAAAEALQCPTLLYNGYGSHRIEGIGDKHIPWIHNIKTMDMVIDIDDDDCMRLLRLFNEPAGREYLKKQGVAAAVVDRLNLMGISSIANLVGCIKMAKYYEMNDDSILVTVATDSMDMYGSRFEEEREEHGDYGEVSAIVDFEKSIRSQTVDWMQELTYWDKKRMHNLKYFTWIEQQGKEVEELDAQWYDDEYWSRQFHAYEEWDELIKEFNEKTGLIKKYR